MRRFSIGRRTTDGTTAAATLEIRTGAVAAISAAGTITLTGQPSAGNTFKINNTTMTWAAAAANESEITIGGSAELSIDAAVTAINIHTVLSLVCTAVKVSTDQLKITWDATGVIGNAIVFTEAMANATVNGNGFLGGTTLGKEASVNTHTKIMEITIGIVNATASIFGLGRPAARGVTPTTPADMLGENNIDGTSIVTTAVAWATGPTIPTAFFRRASLPATAGSSMIWTFPKGIIVPIDNSMVIWNLASNSVAEVSIAIEEQ